MLKKRTKLVIKENNTKEQANGQKDDWIARKGDLNTRDSR